MEVIRSVESLALSALQQLQAIMDASSQCDEEDALHNKNAMIEIHLAKRDGG